MLLWLLYVATRDPAWENRAYIYIKSDYFFKYWNFITLCLNGLVINETYVSFTAYNGESNAIYRTRIAYTQGEISGIIWRSAFVCITPVLS